MTIALVNKLEDDQKLADLKTIYDELWQDATTLIKDMKKSVNIYFYAGAITLVLALTSWASALTSFAVVVAGIGSTYAWIYMVGEMAMVIVVLVFGARLVVWGRKLKKRYAKLIEMETIGRKANA